MSRTFDPNDVNRDDDGRFGTKPGHENSGVDLVDQTAPAATTDDDCMDEIALMLGTVEEWDGAADSLEEIANLVERSGRPHPGDTDPAEYVAAFNEMRTARGTAPVSATTRQLDHLALLLGEHEEWDGADYLEDIAQMVEWSGRPHPGGSIPSEEYAVQLANRPADTPNPNQGVGYQA